MHIKSTDPENQDDLVGPFQVWSETDHNYVWPEGYTAHMSQFFEHGQWWVHDIESGACWGLHDTASGAGFEGYDFEQVVDGNFDAFHNEQAWEAEEKEKDPATELLRKIVGGKYNTSIFPEVDACLEAWDGDEAALHLLQTWRKGNVEESTWEEIRELTS